MPTKLPPTNTASPFCQISGAAETLNDVDFTLAFALDHLECFEDWDSLRDCQSAADMTVRLDRLRDDHASAMAMADE